MSYDAVCFDLDSTLCEPIDDRETLLKRAFDQAGVEPYCSVAQLRYASRHVEADTDRAYFEGLFETVADRVGADPSTAGDLAEAYLGQVDPTRVRFRPGARRAIDRARDSGPVGLVTNGSERTQMRKLQALDLADAFDVTVFVDPRNGIPPKPDPAPFQRALGALAVDPVDAIHVGDDLHADVGGANRVGMDVAWVDLGLDEGADRSTHEPTYALTSLEEFDDVLY